MRVVATGALQLRFVSGSGRLQREERAHSGTTQTDIVTRRGINQFAVRERQVRVERQRDRVVIGEIDAKITRIACLQTVACRHFATSACTSHVKCYVLLPARHINRADRQRPVMAGQA